MKLDLLCFNWGEFTDAVKVTEHCRKAMDFDRAIIVHPFPGSGPKDVEVVEAQSASADECWAKEIPQIATADFTVSIHWDGFIINPELWTDHFMDFDYIGCPWRLENLPNPDWRVGSGGFFGFSRRMALAWPRVCDPLKPFDWQVGALKRDKLEALGMKFAPFDLACKWGKECELEDVKLSDSECFGFHGFQYDATRAKYRSALYGG